MTQKVKITVLLEDTSSQPGLESEHGLSLFIESPDLKLLFDTGQTSLLLKNAEKLKIDLKTVNAIVLSHGHYDHTGGLTSVLEYLGRPVDIFLHPAVVEPKFKGTIKNAGTYIGIPPGHTEISQIRCNYIWTEEPTKVGGLFTVTGPVPRVTDFENTGGAFFIDGNCRKADLMIDDQALFFESSKGLVVILGCAHAGVVNTLNYISKLTGQAEIYAVFGGMHLHSVSDERLKKTIEEFRKFEVQMIGPAHCTGVKATEKFRKAFPQAFFNCNTGDVIEFALN